MPVTPDGSSGRKPRNMKRSAPAAASAESSSNALVVVQEDDLKWYRLNRDCFDDAVSLSSVCLQVFVEPYTTICGHTFCHHCLVQSLAHRSQCPLCSRALAEASESAFPSHALDGLLRRRRSQRGEAKRVRAGQADVRGVVGNFVQLLHDPGLDLAALERMADALHRRRLQLQLGDAHTRVQLLREFLERMIGCRSDRLARLTDELNVLNADRERVLTRLAGADAQTQRVPEQDAAQLAEAAAEFTPLRSAEGGETSSATDALSAAQLCDRRARMADHFDDLQQIYLEMRVGEGPIREIVGMACAEGACDTALESFAESLTKMTQYNSYRRRASLRYTNEFNGGMSIVSSIEFDKDGEYFVVAGVTKKIKLYDFNMVLEDKVDVHYPIGEMQCQSKISGVSWNSYTKSLLASSDYNGTVQLWDAWVGKSTRSFEEHEKRCWTVQFSPADPYLLASGSDDAKVKLWSANTDRSVGCIDARVNVCCVYFSPVSRHHLIFGSADHCVHYYDLRQTRQPLSVFRGHKKAVSYVRFCNATEIVSASTDSQLKLWDVGSSECVRTLQGHVNEKNFVGMATDGDFIVCGSETNSVFVYYKGLSRPLMSYDFGSAAPDEQQFGGRPRADSESAEFVSAVCWKRNSNVVVAANSQGDTHILELV